MTKETKILIVEDEPNMRKLLSDTLSDEYTVVTAVDGLDAKEKLKETPFDLVIADLKMPKMSGKELIEYVHSELDPDIMNIIITGHKEIWSPADASDQHVFHYFVKGEFEPKDLKKVVHNAIEYRKTRRKIIDYTNQLKKRTDELAYLKEHLDSITTSAPTGIITTNREMRVASINPVVERMFDVKEAQYLGTLLKKLLDKAFTKTDEITEKVKEAIESGMEKRVDSVSTSKLAENLVVRVVTSPLLDSSKRTMGAVIIIEDITEKERLIKELKTLDKMKSDFISIAAHELKTPLTPVKAYIEMIRAGKLGRTEWRQIEKLNIAEKNIDVLVKLIDDMLDVTRIEAGKLDMRKEKLSIGEVVDIALYRVNLRMGERKCRMSIYVPENLPPIYGDKELMVKVFDNLLSNAVKYTPSHGKITVEVKEEGKKIHAVVADTGMGIPKKDLEKIFERFYVIDGSLTRKHRGIGLGLAITKGIVEGHNGKIWAESKGLHKGSTFHVLLPVMGKEK